MGTAAARDVLAFIGGGEATPAEVAASLGMAPKAAAMTLVRLHRAGDLDREELGKGFVYRLSAQGMHRLAENRRAPADARGTGGGTFVGPDPAWAETQRTIGDIQAIQSKLDALRRARVDADSVRLETEANETRARQQREQLVARRRALIRAGLAAADERLKAAGVDAFARGDAHQVLARELERQVLGHEAELDVEVLAVSIVGRSVAAGAGDRHSEDPDAPAGDKT